MVTLSALLSGSHNSAVQARVLLEEEEPERNVHVFNSCSASSGEVLTALKIRELASSGMPFKKVVREVEQYICQMQTLFVLESLENLRKNGRLTKLQAVVTGALRIKLLMGATPQGEILSLIHISFSPTLFPAPEKGPAPGLRTWGPARAALRSYCCPVGF